MQANSTPEFEIAGVKPAKEDANYLAIVSFAYRPSQFHPVKLTRPVKQDDGWRTFTQAEIEGPSLVRVRTAFLRRSRNDELFVQAPNLDLPWELSKAVAQAANEQLADKEG